MRFRSRTWWLLSLLLLAGVLIWRSGHRLAAVDSRPPAVVAAAVPATTKSIQAASRAVKPSARAGVTNRLAYRLANTTKTVNELARSGHAILLENALIDTRFGGALAIPANLRAQGDSGTYIVQARGPLDDAFRAQLRGAGAEIVAYIPQNAYLVRVSAAGSAQLGALPQTQTVLAYEPYFKIESGLLPLAVNQQPLPEGTALRVLLFADDRAATIDQIQKLGGKIFAEDRSPFGPVVTVQTPADSLAALAGLSGVQNIESYRQPKPANDLSRVTMGITTTPLTNVPSYLNLTGNNVTVGVVDSGVDATHPDLTGRVSGDVPASLVDRDGHGTFVAGIIAGSGLESSTVTNASGSVPGADFSGKAWAADIFAMQSGNTLTRSDFYLQATAASNNVTGTNVFISNNSWNLPGENGYDLTAASYDAAVRDALPTVTGSQPLLFVFPVGNSGGGLDGNGQGGENDTVFSPATAKNVISVGALEQARNITNTYTPLGSTNPIPVFKAGSDSSDEVADYSGRGNVGVGVEGDFGRFKPDVVAPGSYVVSTASTDLDQNAYYNPTNDFTTPYLNFVVASNGEAADVVFVPQNTVSLRLQIIPNVSSTLPLPNLAIYADAEAAPVTFRGSNDVTLTFTAAEVAKDWFFGVQNTSTQTVSFDVYATVVTTNDNGTYLTVLSNLNQSIGTFAPNGHPYYRYESGSSMAAAAVSGTLALMQQFFEQYTVDKTRPSPALMKALLINGARSANGIYDFQAQTPINYQGWGSVQLPSSLPVVLTNSSSASHSPAAMQVYDQNPADALVTGQSRTRNFTLAPAAANLPLRVTLVWTDPPGNPAAGIKLVNDLDLIVTNLVTGEVYFGNDIVSGRDVNSPWQTNSAPNVDFVNNVENVFLQSPGTNFSVSVVGRRVNVNAVTAYTNGVAQVAQDYALVISSGSGEVANALAVNSDPGTVNLPDGRLITDFVSNSVPLLNQHVGANTPYLVSTNGITNQWHFYIYTNSILSDGNFGTNVAFATFLPPTLAVPREGVFEENNPTEATRPEADIDLYVSTDPALLTLSPAVIAAADKSLGQGGTESIIYSNAPSGQVYYVGVKSEDQMSASYGFIGVSSETPFGETDADGNEILHGTPVPVDIPDGSPSHPGAALIFGFSPFSQEVRRVIVTNTVTHELFGDLLGNLSHDGKFAVLNNHTGVGGQTNVTLIYDDSGEGDIPGSRPSDGPGSLQDFVGEKSGGLWLFTMVDNAPGATGRVDNLTIKIEPQMQTNGVTSATIQPGGFFYDFVKVPVGATNLTITVSGNSGPLPMTLLLRRGAFPTPDAYDASNSIPVGIPGSLTLNETSLPVLQPDIYIYAVYNPPGNPVQHVIITTTIGLDLNGETPTRFTSTGNEPLLDDAVNYSSITVANQTNNIVATEVGLRIDHPRESDLAITLVSPHGTRVLLAENRGSTDTNGYGSSVTNNFVFPVATPGGGTNAYAYTNIVPVSGTLYDTFTPLGIPDSLDVYYQGSNILHTGFISGTDLPFSVNYSGTSTEMIFVIDQGGNPNVPPAQTNIWTNTTAVVQSVYNYFTFTEDTNKTTTPIKFYPPPFRGSVGGNVMSSDFEGIAPGNYGAADGWTAAAGQVIVDNSAAYTGTNSAALTNATIFRTLPTVAGHNYALSYAYEKASVPGVLAGPILNPANGHYYYLLETNSWTASESLAVALGGHLAAINDVNEQNWVYNTFSAYGGVDRTLWIGLNNPAHDSTVNINHFVWTSGQPVAYTDWSSGEPNDFGGVEWYVFIFNPADLRAGFWDDSDNFGTIGGFTNRIPVNGVVEVTSILPDPSARVTLSGVSTNTLTPTNTSWQVASQTFTAPQSGTALTIQGLQSGLLLDTFQLVDLGVNAYALPEESLDELKGESANGTWQLEVWDNRVGAFLPGGNTLVSWQLSFVFENTLIPPTGPVLPGIPPQTVDELTQLTVTNTATPLDTTFTNLVYFPVNYPSGVSISSAGIITWIPSELEGPGIYTITTIVTDNHVPPRSSTNSFMVTVNEVNVAPVLPAQSNRVVSALSQLVVTNTATDSDIPTNTLTYVVLVNGVTNVATIDPNGVITWTPGTAQAGSSFVFTTIVTDYNPVALTNQQLSATNSFIVTVKTGVTVLGGPGDLRGTGIKYFNGALYICGNSTVAGGLAASFSLPLAPSSVPLWNTNWPSANPQDLFYGVTATSNGVYVAGPDYTRTTDTSGGKEDKGLVVKFPFTGATGAGFNGAIWDRQTPAAPGAFSYSGGEGLNAVITVNEGGINYLYATGSAQHDAGNGGRLFISKLAEDSTVLWTTNDSANVPAEPFSGGFGLAALNGGIYAGGVLNGQPYLRKYDSTGALTWSRTSSISGIYNGVAAISNYIYAVGSVGTGTNTDFLIEKWDESGNLMWSRAYDNAASNQDALNGVVGVVRRVFAVGYTRGATAGGADAALLEIDPGTGTLLSTTLIGDVQDDIANGVDTDVTNSLYIIGESRSYGNGSNEVLLVQYPVPPPASFSIGSATLTNNTVQLQWVAPTYEIFQVQWTSNLLFWNAFTNAVYSQDGTYNFTDDGSQTGGLGPYRFYRLLLLP